jgi:hypothetical protein
MREEADMNSFNRIVVTLLLLALIPIITVALIVPQEAVDLVQEGLDRIEGQLGASVSTQELMIRVGLALLIDVVLIFLLYLELRRPAKHGVPVRQVKGGEAQIAIDSVIAQLEYHLDPLPGVLDVKPDVIPRRGGVEVALEVEMAADANMAANIEELSAITRRVVEEEMGLKLKGKPKLNLRTVPSPRPVTSPELFGPTAPEVDEGLGEAEPTDFGEVDEPGSTDTPE